MGRNTEAFDLYRAIVEASGTGVLVVDYESLEILYASESVASFFPEAGEKPFLGQTLGESLAAIDSEAAKALSDKTRSGGFWEWSHFFRAYGREYRFSGKRTAMSDRDVFILYMFDSTDSYKEKVRIRNHYHSQITMMSGVSPYALGMYRMNLSRNEFNPQVLGRTSDGLRNQIPKTVDEFFDYAYEHCGTRRDEKLFGSIFSRYHLLAKYAEGFPNHSLQHLYYMEGNRPTWITTAINMARNPDTGDVEAILYTVDTNREKITEEMLLAITQNDYEYISLIDASTGLCASLFDIRREPGRNLLQQGVPFDRHTEAYFSAKQEVEDLKGVVESLRLSTVIRELEARKETSALPSQDTPVYERTYSFLEKDHRRYKRAAFYRVNDAENLICHTIQDITTLTELETQQQEKLSQAYAQTKSALDEKNVILSRISRDIRIPMNAITGLTNLALTELRDEAAVGSYLRKIADSSANVVSIVEEILALRQIEEQQISLQPEVVEIPQLVKEVEGALLSHVREKGQVFTVSYYGLETEKVMADRFRVKTILKKLLENAVIYTQEGGHISLSVEEKRRENGKAYLAFVVSDDGCGMSEAKLRRHFGPAAETVDVLEKSNDRIGLGLAIVRSYVRAMEGELKATSREGVGSEITVILPFEMPFLDIAERTGLADEPDTFDFTGKHILLVDDHKLSRQIGKKMLENVGATAETAKDGAEAVRLFEEKGGAYDLVLMDIRMPEMNGLEACRNIRHTDLPNASAVPIVAMTADAFEDDIRASFDAGMNAHLAKPIDPKNLYRTMQSFFRARA